MRNLKRALSLTLASVMLLGMMVMGTSAASFPDVDDNDNVEAIAVLKATGVMIGDNGNFKPDAPVTRNEMAVIMTNMLGLNANDFAGACPFTDVAGWAQNYVAACYANGIIAGRSATVFDGQATVTATEAAAMMMRALGYFQHTEDYTNNGGFTAATVKQAASIRLFDGITSNANTPMNRNDVAQLALNTLEADVVEFTGTVGMEVDMGDGKKVNVGYNGKYDPKRDGGSYNYTGDDIPDKDTDATHQYLYLQLCEQLYDNKLKKVGNSNDDFGRPAAQWNYKGEDIIAATKQPVATFTKEMKEEDIFKELGAAGINGSSARYVVMDEIWENGAKVASAEEIGTSGQFQAVGGATGGYNDTVIIAKGDSSNAAGFGNGISVEIYETDKSNHYVMVIVKSSMAKVTNVVTAKDKTTYTIGGVGYVDYVDEADEDKIVLNGSVAKNDYVTYAVVKGKAYVWPTTSVTGTQTAKTNKNVVTIAGEQYTIGTGVVNVDPTDFNNSDKEAIYYIDRLGYVVETTSTAASTDYVFIISTKGDLSTTIDGSTPSVEARVLLADGTVGVYDIKVKKLKASDDLVGQTASNDDLNSSITLAAGDYVIDGTKICVYDADFGSQGVSNTSATVAAAAKHLLSGTYGYTTKDKEMTLEGLTAFSGSTAADTTYSVTLTGSGQYVAKDKTSYSIGGKTILVDRDTQFVVYNSDKKTATIYTGAANLPTAITALNKDGYTVLKTGTTANTGTASVIFINHNDAIAADGTDVYVYVDADSQVKVRVDGSDKYTYEFTRADGTKETSAAGDSKATGLYLLNEDNTIGDPASATRYKGKAQLSTDGDVKLVGIGDDYWNITDETQIVYIDDLSEINGNDGWVVLKVKDGAATSDVEAIFVVKHETPAQTQTAKPTVTATNQSRIEWVGTDAGNSSETVDVTVTSSNTTGVQYTWKIWDATAENNTGAYVAITESNKASAGLTAVPAATADTLAVDIESAGVYKYQVTATAQDAGKTRSEASTPVEITLVVMAEPTVTISKSGGSSIAADPTDGDYKIASPSDGEEYQVEVATTSGCTFKWQTEVGSSDTFGASAVKGGTQATLTAATATTFYAPGDQTSADNGTITLTIELAHTASTLTKDMTFTITVG